MKQKKSLWIYETDENKIKIHCLSKKPDQPIEFIIYAAAYLTVLFSKKKNMDINDCILILKKLAWEIKINNF